MRLVKESLDDYPIKGIMNDSTYQAPRWGSMSQQESSDDEKSSFEGLGGEDAVEARRKELKAQGYYIKGSKVSAGFTAKKGNARIVVRLK